LASRRSGAENWDWKTADQALGEQYNQSAYRDRHKPSAADQMMTMAVVAENVFVGIIRKHRPLQSRRSAGGVRIRALQ
jgi:hypothetical protein